MDTAHSARIYDYWLGGKDNFPVDRDAAAQVLAVHPAARTTAVENRAFLHRVVRHLAVGQGVRQFLDIGTGIPTSPNTHEVAQAVAPDASVVYVDNDPMVLAHARALMSSTPEGRTAFLDADLHDPEAILKDPKVCRTLDFDRPVGLLLMAVLHFFPQDAAAGGIVRRLLDALAPGSFVAISHATYDFPSPSLDRALEM
jgi:trans-aconitate methyltransferase